VTGLLAHAPLLAQAPAAPDATLGGGETVLFVILAPLMVLAALGLLFVKKAVHAAVLVAFVMICLAVMYAAQDAQFLFAAQIVVYTGAVMMLFLFVLMLVGVDSADTMVETIKGQRWIGLLAGLGIFVLVGGAVTGFTLSVLDVTLRLPFTDASPLEFPPPQGLETANADGNPVGVARLIFGRYVFTFEVVGTLLIIAAVGAILMTHRERLTPRPSQRTLSERRVRDGGQVPPLPAPGVFARHNAVDTPALLPDGSPSELSVSRVLRVRGQNQSHEGLAGQVAVIRDEISGRDRPGTSRSGRDTGNASPEVGEDAAGSPPGDPADPIGEAGTPQGTDGTTTTGGQR
jgi:NADH-quinone oxidoreductase subunit J